MSLPLTYHPALEAARPARRRPSPPRCGSLPWADQVRVAAIDPAVADTAQFCETYGVALVGERELRRHRGQARVRA